LGDIYHKPAIVADTHCIRISRRLGLVKKEDATPEKVEKAGKLNAIAAQRGQSLAQMALQWVLRDDVVTSALIGASCPEQILENVRAMDAAPFTAEELAAIEGLLG